MVREILRLGNPALYKKARLLHMMSLTRCTPLPATFAERCLITENGIRRDTLARAIRARIAHRRPLRLARPAIRGFPAL